MIFLLTMKVLANSTIQCGNTNQNINCHSLVYPNNQYYNYYYQKCSDEDCHKVMNKIKCENCSSDCYKQCQLRGYKYGYVNQPILVPYPTPKPETATVTVIESQEKPPIVTVTHSEFKTVTVDPPIKESSVKTKKRKHKKKKSKLDESESSDLTIVPKKLKKIKLKIPEKFNEVDCNESKIEKISVNSTTEPLVKLPGGDVTVTRVVEKTATIEKPFTLYREFTTTVTSEKPIINYKVTTMTSFQTTTETKVITVSQNYRSTSNYHKENCEGIDCISRPIVTINRCEYNNIYIPPVNEKVSTVFVCITPKITKHINTQTKEIPLSIQPVTVTVERSIITTPPEVTKTVTVDKEISSDIFKTVTVEKTTPIISIQESIKTVTVEKIQSSTPEFIKTIIVEKTISPQISTTSSKSVSVITKIVTVNKSKSTSKKRKIKLSTKGCELTKVGVKFLTVCKLGNVPKSVSTSVDTTTKKPKKTVFRTIYSTASKEPCTEDKVVTKTVFE